MCSKHVEAWNKLILKQKCCASSWLITEINLLELFYNQQNLPKMQVYFLQGPRIIATNTIIFNLFIRWQYYYYYYYHHHHHHHLLYAGYLYLYS